MPAVFDLGKQERGAIRVEWDRHVYRAVAQARAGGLSAPARIELAPGRSVSRRISLDEWVRFTKPGTYRVRIVFEGADSLAREAAGLLASHEVQVTVTR